jgi:hypothetical protein
LPGKSNVVGLVLVSIGKEISRLNTVVKTGGSNVDFNKHFGNIVKANNDNRLAIFVGAGISKSSENASVKLPTWNDLINDLKTDLRLPTEENDYLKIAQLYFLEFKEFTYYEKLKAYFPSHIEPSVIHNLIFDINPQCVITTNWDILLDKTIENNGYIFDAVCSDDDLVKSTLEKKYIKMHGDFKNHNIVFKEDDYLSYKYNFPLIENYVKSILSTHTVLFLGYSYNDMNLKHIMKWLQNHSKVSPPRYLLSFKSNTTQEKYLENHDIKVLVWEDEDPKFSSLGSISCKVATFLNSVANPSRFFIGENDDGVIGYIYLKLKTLNELNSILLEQISGSLTNCGFIHTPDGLVLLKFWTGEMTSDYDENERAVHAKFLELIKRYDDKNTKHPQVQSIFEILTKANIDGIAISEDNYLNLGQIKSPSNTEILKHAFNFDFKCDIKSTGEINKMAELAYISFLGNDYIKAYNISEEIITLSLRQRNYIQVFISMFNINNLLPLLRFSLGNYGHQFKEIKKYDLRNKFKNLPEDLQKALDPIYRFISFDYLYKFAFNVSQDLKKKEDAKKTIEAGGFVFNSNITESAAKHKNLIYFIINNKIMIEHFVEYKTINKQLLNIALVRQTQKEVANFSRVELYALIKRIDNKELILMFNPSGASFNHNFKSLKITDDDREWLIDTVLTNLSELFISTKNLSNRYEECLKNSKFILSLANIRDCEIKKVMDLFWRVLANAKNTIGIYEAINNFLGLQFRIFKLKIRDEDLIKLIEILINKIVYKNFNMYDHYAITNNFISNLYGYAKENKAILNNRKLILKLLAELDDSNVSDKIKVSQSLLLSVYDISNQLIKDDIKKFMLNIDTKWNHTVEAISFEMILIIYKFANYDPAILEKLNTYLDQFEDGKRFSSALYPLKHQLTYLVEDMSLEQFRGVLDRVKRSIKDEEERPDISVF